MTLTGALMIDPSRLSPLSLAAALCLAAGCAQDPWHRASDPPGATARLFRAELPPSASGVGLPPCQRNTFPVCSTAAIR